MLAIALALAGSVAWGVADFLGGLKSRGLSVLVVLAVSQAIGLGVIAIAVLASGEAVPGVGPIVVGALAAVAGVVGLGAYYQGLAVGVMSIVAPISATAPIIPVAVGVAGGERPSSVQGVGLALVVVGVVLASRETDGRHGSRGARAARGVGLALVAAVGFGCLFVGLDAATENGDLLWVVLVTRVTALALVGCALLLARPGFAVKASDLPALATIGVLDMSAFSLFALASGEGLLSVVAVLNSLYPVVTILLARIVLDERVRRPQVAGIGVVFTGVALIVTG